MGPFGDFVSSAPPNFGGGRGVVTASHDEKIGLPAFKVLRETLDLIAFDNDALSDNPCANACAFASFCRSS